MSQIDKTLRNKRIYGVTVTANEYKAARSALFIGSHRLPNGSREAVLESNLTYDEAREAIVNRFNDAAGTCYLPTQVGIISRCNAVDSYLTPDGIFSFSIDGYHYTMTM